MRPFSRLEAPLVVDQRSASLVASDQDVRDWASGRRVFVSSLITDMPAARAAVRAAIEAVGAMPVMFEGLGGQDISAEQAYHGRKYARNSSDRSWLATRVLRQWRRCPWTDHFSVFEMLDDSALCLVSVVRGTRRSYLETSGVEICAEALRRYSLLATLAGGVGTRGEGGNGDAGACHGRDGIRWLARCARVAG